MNESNAGAVASTEVLGLVPKRGDGLDLLLHRLRNSTEEGRHDSLYLEAATVIERLDNQCNRLHGAVVEQTTLADSEGSRAVDHLRRARKAEAEAKTFAHSYEMAVARLVLAMDYMHPEQKRAFNAAWAEKRAELRDLGLKA